MQWFYVINATETTGLDRLLYLEVREVSVELWEQKADDEVLKTVNTRKGRQ